MGKAELVKPGENVTLDSVECPHCKYWVSLTVNPKDKVVLKIEGKIHEGKTNEFACPLCSAVLRYVLQP